LSLLAKELLLPTRFNEDSMGLIEIEHRLGRILEQFGTGLPPEQLRDMQDLVKAGEPGVAFENYCTQMFEYGMSLPAAVVEELDRLGREMGINEEYWERLR
jgi:hypothetical protein